MFVWRYNGQNYNAPSPSFKSFEERLMSQIFARERKGKNYPCKWLKNFEIRNLCGAKKKKLKENR